MEISDFKIEIQDVSPHVVVATDNNFYTVNAAGIAPLLYPVQNC